MRAPGEDGKKKVLVVIGKLEGGGAERVVVRLLTYLDREKFAPLLVVFEKEGALLGDVPADVKILDCGRHGEGGTIRWFGKLVWLFRQERPAVVLSFMWFANAVAILSRYLSRVPCGVVVSERSTLLGSREGFAAELSRRISIFLLYRCADKIVCNSVAMKRQFLDRFRIPERKLSAIYNPVDIADISRQAEEKDNPPGLTEDLPVVAGMGRLSREKGFDLLIRAAKKVRTPFRLLLLGKGNEEGNLLDLSERLGIRNRLILAGFQKNPYPYFRNASIFVLPSRYEGFPNALVEAMALGLPCVATRCPTGPEEIITDGEDGLLVPVEDPAALAEAIDRLLGDASLRERLGNAARESVRKYDAPGIVRQFEALLEKVAV